MPLSLLRPWYDALLCPGSHFDVSLFGLAGRLRIIPPWGMSYTLENHLFYFVAEGFFEARWPGFEGRVNAGDLVWAGQGALIHFHLPDEANLVLWRFRLNAWDEAGASLPAPHGVWHLPGARGSERWMQSIVDAAGQAQAIEPERLRGLLLCLLTEAERTASRTVPHAAVFTSHQREILMKYLAGQLRRRPTAAEMARLLELSPDYFTRCFRRTYGLAPRRWIMEERIRVAALRLLESSLSVSQIAAELGYEDVFLFSRQFKHVTGLSPANYRKQHGGIVRFGKPAN